MPAPSTPDLYPLQLAPLLKDKVWGADRLARWFPQGAAGRLIGEVWAVWDELPVENGPYRGARLSDLVRSYPEGVLGSRLVGMGPSPFPLLVKFVDTREALSVQVHPADEYARRHENQPFGKAEMWYVIHAEPGARLFHGVKQRLTRAMAERAVASGTLQDVLDSVEVNAGDVIMNHPGTIHALGPGLLLYELQQSSDLTYRLYDWNRNHPSRPLDVARALDVADLEPLALHTIAPLKVHEAGALRTYLCACRWFAVELLQVHDTATERLRGRCFHILTTLHGSGTLEPPNSHAGLPLRPGQSVLVPAAIDEYALRVANGPWVVLKGYVPDLLADVIGPLRERGFSDRQILQLAGSPDSRIVWPSARVP